MVKRNLKKEFSKMVKNEGRRYGNPRSEIERKKRHLAKFGSSELPPRGSGNN